MSERYRSREIAASDFVAHKSRAKYGNVLDGGQHFWLERMRNAWVAYHAGAPWMAAPDAEKWPRYAGKLFSDFTRAESSVRRLTAEVERLQAEWDREHARTGDVRRLLGSVRLDRDRLRAEVERLRSGIRDLRQGIARKCHPASEVGAEMAGVIACLDALAREDGAS